MPVETRHERLARLQRELDRYATLPVSSIIRPLERRPPVIRSAPAHPLYHRLPQYLKDIDDRAARTMVPHRYEAFHRSLTGTYGLIEAAEAAELAVGGVALVRGGARLLAKAPAFFFGGRRGAVPFGKGAESGFASGDFLKSPFSAVRSSAIHSWDWLRKPRSFWEGGYQAQRFRPATAPSGSGLSSRSPIPALSRTGD